MNNFFLSSHNVDITAGCMFNAALSCASDNLFIWNYTIAINNKRVESIQIIERSLQIFDEKGLVNKIIDHTVCGQKPIIKANGLFEYTSYCHLRTVSGLIRGNYQATLLETGETINLLIPTISLDIPDVQVLHN